MQKAAGGAVAPVAFALVLTAVLPATAQASGPMLTLVGASSGFVGSTVTYDYSWDVPDCSAAGVSGADTVILVWENPLSSEQIGSTGVTIGPAEGNCSGTVSGRVPGDAGVGDRDVSTAYLQQSSGPIGGSEATANTAFVVISAPALTPIPTSRPAPRPTSTSQLSMPPTPAQSRGGSSTRAPKDSVATGTMGLHSADAAPGGPSSPEVVVAAAGPSSNGANLLSEFPGGWFELGLLGGVGLLAVVAATFLTLERRRFARMYPNEGSHRQR